MAHLYTYTCMDMILIYQYIFNRFFVDVAVLFANVSYFLPTLLLKLFYFLQVGFFQLISLKFPSCCLPQANLIQNFIRFSISKRQVQKPKLSLISFHLYGMMITFWGLMKKTGNTYGVIKVSKESMLLRLFLTYWGRKLSILKVFMFLIKNLI